VLQGECKISIVAAIHIFCILHARISWIEWIDIDLVHSSNAAGLRYLVVCYFINNKINERKIHNQSHFEHIQPHTHKMTICRLGFHARPGN
jgi:hypothetical protein